MLAKVKYLIGIRLVRRQANVRVLRWPAAYVTDGVSGGQRISTHPWIQPDTGG